MIVAAVALALAAQASEPSTSKASVPDITVTARAQEKQLSSIIRKLVAEIGGRQLARFETAICPRVIGGRPAFTAAFMQMVRQNMVDAGARLAPARCRANAVVIFTAEPGKLARETFRGTMALGNLVDRSRRLRLLTGNDAIRSFQLAELQTGDGVAVNSNFEGPGLVRDIRATRISPPTRQAAFFALALVDTDDARTKSIRQLADLATLHLLLNIDEDAAEKADDSILGLFVRDDAPAQMTAFDRGMLKGMYRANGNGQFGYVQRGRMAATIRQEQATTAAPTPAK